MLINKARQTGAYMHNAMNINMQINTDS